MCESRLVRCVLAHTTPWLFPFCLVFTGCAWQQAQTCCPIYPPSRYRCTHEAVRVPPCGPDAIFHGFKKTAWNVWPEGWEFFPTNCPPQTIETVVEPPRQDAPQDEPIYVNPAEEDLPQAPPAGEGVQGTLEAPEPDMNLPSSGDEDDAADAEEASPVIATTWEDEWLRTARVPARVRRLPPVGSE